MRYDGHGRKLSLTDARGYRAEMRYDGHGWMFPLKTKPGVTNPDGSAPAPTIVEAEYDIHNIKAQSKPLWIKDANGNFTRWTYAPEHGGVLTETGPAVDGVTPQKRNTYVQRQARLWDGSAAGPPVWLLERTAFCRTGNPATGGGGCAAGAADEVVTAYDYGPESGPNNLLLRGQAVTADGQTLRTCFAYDAQGRKISETSPGGTAGLSACPGAPPTSALPYTSSIRYDADGQVTGTIAPDPDGAGPVPSPAVRNSYDAAGRLVRVEEGSLATWQSEATAPANWPGFTVHKMVETQYDALDRKVRTVFHWAGITEYGYDLHGRVRCTAVRMNPDAWATPLPDKCVPGPAHAVNGADRISRNVYDAAGQLIEVWDGVGTPLQRREALYAYNGNGQRTSLTDARGYRAEMRYDGHGRQARWIFPSKTTPGVADQGDYEEYGYDPNGNRTSLRKRDGQVLGFAYDALNRVTIKDAPGPERDVRYGYWIRLRPTRGNWGNRGQ
jgi:YD repeat-containing protein